MHTTHTNKPVHTLSERLKRKHALNDICAEAVQQQIESGHAEATHLRNRRRYLHKQILRRIPHSNRLSPKQLLHAAMMVLAVWGFGGMAMPQQASAAPVFKHTTLAGFDVGFYAAPTFVDIDGDGDLDAFVGERYGTVKFYRNTGTATAPVFTATGVNDPNTGLPVVNPLAGFDVGDHATPTFADIDNDGDLDAFVGNYLGTVKFYRNTGTATAPVFTATGVNDPNTGLPVVNPLVGFDVGTFASPSFADIDNDGDFDAFVGENAGTVKFYRNTGTAAAPAFTATGVNDPNTGLPVVNPLVGFDVGFRATPTFADIDNDGDLDAFAGEGSGTVRFYRNNDASGNGTAPVFAADAAGNPLVGFDVGYKATPTFADIDNDGDLDAFVGGMYSPVKFYRNTGTVAAPVFAADPANPLAGFDVGDYATPSFADIDNDGDLDAFVGEFFGTVKFYRNTGTVAAPVFAADPANPLAGVAVYSYAAPSFADIDGDGDLDAFVGEYYGTVKFYRNNGTAAAPVFAADVAGNPLAGVAVGYYAAPTFADIDNDGDLDAFVGGKNGTVKFYENTGSATAPVFAAANGTTIVNPLAGFDVGYNATPIFTDIDGDGDLDAFVGGKNGTVKFYRNTGTVAAPVFAADAAGNPLAGFDVGAFASPSFADIDNDGDLDAFAGEKNGTVQFLENFDPSPPNNPPAPTAPAITTNEDTPATSQVVHNDPDVGDTHTYAVTTAAANGTASVDAAGLATYTPGLNFNGADSFVVTVTDAAGATGNVTINVTVNAVNDAPVPTAPGITTSKATPGTSQVFPNDPDVGDTHTYAVTTAAANGTATVDAAGLATYTPNTGFAGNDSFTVTVTDAAGATGTVTINVTVNVPAVSTVGLSLNGSTFNSTSNKVMTLNATTVASNPVTHADVYVALQLPDGTLLFMQPGGGFGTTLTPLLSNVSVPDFTGPIFNFTFSGAEPAGNYTWFAALTVPGSTNIIGTLATVPFSFAP